MSTSEALQSDLKVLGAHLLNKGIIKSDAPMRSACDKLKRDPSKCEIIGLELTPVSAEYIRGNEWESSLNVRLSVEIQINNNFSYEDAHFIAINIEYSALHAANHNECKGAWHFDYHVNLQGSDCQGEDRYIHPYFHVHHGGRKLKDLSSFGDLVILKSPRLIHHPLDALLAIDLTLATFLPSTLFNQIRSDTQYRMMMTRSQENWWKPFYEKLGEYWRNKKINGALAKESVRSSKTLNPLLF